MKIYYQGIPGSYSYIASKIANENISEKDNEIIGLPNFADVRNILEQGGIGVLPIENSYAGSIHQNFYGFLRHDYEIIGEIILEINHCLLSKEKNISDIKKVYSHPQALAQCHEYSQKHGFEIHEMGDTALSAQTLSQNNENGTAAIASKQAGEIYGLNILEEGIQDQKGNRTRFVVIKSRKIDINYTKLTNKCSLLFKTKNIPASLYKCLGGFATNHVNLTKIESLPALQDPFSYMFWIDFEGNTGDVGVQNALEELKFFCTEYKILGEY